MSRRRAAALAAAVLAAITTGAGPTARAGEPAADTAVGFLARASVEDVGVRWSVPRFAVVEDIVDGGGTYSRAELDGGGNGRALASLPYPGDTVLAGPGLFAFATGQSLPGGYPFFVTAETPLTPKGELTDPSGHYRLQAEATARRASGLAELLAGSDDAASRSQGLSSVEVAPDGTVRASAEQTLIGLDLGGRLQIGKIYSMSLTVLAPGATEPTTTTTFTLDGITAGGHAVTLGPDGLRRADAPPGKGDGGDGGLAAALAQAGIELHLKDAEAIPGGQRARSLEIRLRRAGPAPGFPDQIVTVTLGTASSAIVVGS